MGLNLFLRIIILVFSVCFGAGYEYQPPVPLQAVAGGRMSLPCNISSDDDEMSLVLWFKKERPGRVEYPIYVVDAIGVPMQFASHYRNKDLYDRGNFLKSGLLQVDPVTADDGGIYHCKVYFKWSYTPRLIRINVTVVGLQGITTAPPKPVTDEKTIFPIRTTTTDSATTDTEVLITEEDNLENVNYSSNQHKFYGVFSGGIRTINDVGCAVYLCVLHLFWMCIFKNWW